MKFTLLFYIYVFFYQCDLVLKRISNIDFVPDLLVKDFLCTLYFFRSGHCTSIFVFFFLSIDSSLSFFLNLHLSIQ